MKDKLDSLVIEMYAKGIFYSEAVKEFKKRFMAVALLAESGNQCRAAHALHMHRNTLSRKLEQLGLDASDFRSKKPARSVKSLVREKRA